MKIGTLYTLYGRRAGAELFFEMNIKGLHDNFQDISLVIYCNQEAYNTLELSSPRLRKVLVPQLNDQFKKALWLEFLSFKNIAEDRLDLFWIPSGTNSFPGRWNIPTVVTFLDFGEYHVKNKYDFKRTVFRKYISIPRSIKRGAAFTTISHATSNDLRSLFRKESTVIYPGSTPRSNDHASFAVNSEAVIFQETGQKLNTFFLVPGRTDYNGKGLDLLLQACSHLIKTARNSPLVISVGPQGEQHDTFIDSIKALRLENNVRWLGRVSDKCLQALYLKCEAVIIPSRFEGFGFPVLEAMLHEVPIVCSDAGSLPEVAGDAALIFKNGDYLDLADKMLSISSDNLLRERLITAGRKQLTKFDWNKSFAGLYELFRSTAINL